MNIGYTIIGQDNDSYMCASCDRVFSDMPGLNVCPDCGYRTDFAYTNPTFTLTRTKFDLSHTYDGACIVSERFREFCVRHQFESLEFRTLPRAKGLYHFFAHRVVPFDASARKTCFGALCPTCGFHESVTGATPSFLKVSAPLPDGFSRSDLLFGSRNAKSPLIFVGTNTKELLDHECFRGICFKSAMSNSNVHNA
jgi:hypothetical protein